MDRYTFCMLSPFKISIFVLLLDHNTNIITIISGGHIYSYSLVIYNIVRELMIDFGENYLLETLGNENGENGTNHFTQIGNILYISDYSGATINVYNLETLSFTQIMRTHFDDDNYASALTSSSFPTPRLYLVGGYRWNSNKFRVLDLEDMVWLDNMPDLIISRRSRGCGVIKGTLWVVGGYNQSTVEAISITDIMSSSWVQMESLPVDLYGAGVFEVDDLIYIVGGYVLNVGYSKTVYTIDTSTGAVSNYSDLLPYPISHMYPILVKNVIYGFGGNSGGGYRDSWVTGITGTCLFVTCLRILQVGSLVGE